MSNREQGHSWPAAEEERPDQTENLMETAEGGSPEELLPEVGEATTAGKGKRAALIAAGVAALAALTVLSVLLFLQVGQTRKFREESEQFQLTLSQTEEGKRLLEKTNEQLGNQNKQLDAEAAEARQKAEDAGQRAQEADQKAAEADQKAAEAEREKAEAEKAAAAAAADLRQKKAELDELNNTLSGKQAALEKANRGIAKFKELETLFTSYSDDSETFSAALDQAWMAIALQDQVMYDDNVRLLNTVGPRMDATRESIVALLDDIENQNY